ncbi:MAG: hypothetical protein KF845_15430 [Cyclobacteriaceae bacterium]|nr:hypothetical protein [Cyclobacteriaceae bacterium]
MRWYLVILLVALSFNLYSQNGYVKISSDSIMIGFVKRYTSHMDGSKGLEVWRTKNDPQPIRVKMSSIYEYAIKKDTFRILHDFIPFASEKIYFETVEAQVISTGKVTLLKINALNDRKRSTQSMIIYTGERPVSVMTFRENNYTYVLEEPGTDYLRALPYEQQKLLETLKEFFPERYLIRYKEEKGAIVYSKVPALVKLYNSVR